jgi:hypothetical protein
MPRQIFKVQYAVGAGPSNRRYGRWASQDRVRDPAGRGWHLQVNLGGTARPPREIGYAKAPRRTRRA